MADDSPERQTPMPPPISHSPIKLLATRSDELDSDDDIGGDQRVPPRALFPSSTSAAAAAAAKPLLFSSSSAADALSIGRAAVEQPSSSQPGAGRRPSGSSAAGNQGRRLSAPRSLSESYPAATTAAASTRANANANANANATAGMSAGSSSSSNNVAASSGRSYLPRPTFTTMASSSSSSSSTSQTGTASNQTGTFRPSASAGGHGTLSGVLRPSASSHAAFSFSSSMSAAASSTDNKTSAISAALFLAPSISTGASSSLEAAPPHVSSGSPTAAATGTSAAEPMQPSSFSFQAENAATRKTNWGGLSGRADDDSDEDADHGELGDVSAGAAGQPMRIEDLDRSDKGSTRALERPAAKGSPSADDETLKAMLASATKPTPADATASSSPLFAPSQSLTQTTTSMQPASSRMASSFTSQSAYSAATFGTHATKITNAFSAADGAWRAGAASSSLGVTSLSAGISGDTWSRHDDMHGHRSLLSAFVSSQMASANSRSNGIRNTSSQNDTNNSNGINSENDGDKNNSNSINDRNDNGSDKDMRSSQFASSSLPSSSSSSPSSQSGEPSSSGATQIGESESVKGLESNTPQPVAEEQTRSKDAEEQARSKDADEHFAERRVPPVSYNQDIEQVESHMSASSQSKSATTAPPLATDAGMEYLSTPKMGQRKWTTSKDFLIETPNQYLSQASLASGSGRQYAASTASLSAGGAGVGAGTGTARVSSFAASASAAKRGDKTTISSSSLLDTEWTPMSRTGSLLDSNGGTLSSYSQMFASVTKNRSEIKRLDSRLDGKLNEFTQIVIDQSVMQQQRALSIVQQAKRFTRILTDWSVCFDDLRKQADEVLRIQ